MERMVKLTTKGKWKEMLNGPVYINPQKVRCIKSFSDSATGCVVSLGAVENVWVKESAYEVATAMTGKKAADLDLPGGCPSVHDVHFQSVPRPVRIGPPGEAAGTQERDCAP